MLANIAQLILWLIIVTIVNSGGYKIAMALFAHDSSSAFDFGVFTCVSVFVFDLLALNFLFDKEEWQ